MSNEHAHKYIKEGWMNEDQKHRVENDLMEGRGYYNEPLYKLEEAFGTDDFANLLYDAAHVDAMKGFDEIPQTWRTVCSVVTRTDFKTNYIVQADGGGRLYKRLEREGVSADKVTDRKESYAVFPYDKEFPITMEAMRNDATGELMKKFRGFGKTAGRTLQWFVWDATVGLLGGTGSGGYATMSSGYPVFSASHATGANYATSTALTEANLEAGVTLMVNQKDLDADEILGVYPKWLIVPPAIQGVAKKLTRSDIMIHATTETDAGGDDTLMGNINAIKDYNIQVVVEPRLASTEWILAADPNQYPVVEMGFLDGKTEPEIMESDRNWFSHRERSIKAQICFGGVPADWRGLYKGVG